MFLPDRTNISRGPSSTSSSIKTIKSNLKFEEPSQWFWLVKGGCGIVAGGYGWLQVIIGGYGWLVMLWGGNRGLKMVTGGHGWLWDGNGWSRVIMGGYRVVTGCYWWL